MLWGLTTWFILTLVVIKFRIVKPLRFTIRFGIDKSIKLKPNLSKVHVKLGFFKIAFNAIKVNIPLTITLDTSYFNFVNI